MDLISDLRIRFLITNFGNRGIAVIFFSALDLSTFRRTISFRESFASYWIDLGFLPTVGKTFCRMVVRKMINTVIMRFAVNFCTDVIVAIL